MAAAPIQPPIGETYYPPRFPIEPPYEYIQPTRLLTAACSAVELTNHRGIPDIKTYLLMGKPIDIYRARNPTEIRVFQRIYSIETLCNLIGVPRLARDKIQDCFAHLSSEMRVRYYQRVGEEIFYSGGVATQLDFWSLFQYMYAQDMMNFRGFLLQNHPHLMLGIDWRFLLGRPFTDVGVIILLWILSVWHTRQTRAQNGVVALEILARQLHVLIPCREYSGVAG